MPDDLLCQINLNNPVVALIGNENMFVRQPGILHRRIQQIRPQPGLPKLAILPDDVAEGIHQKYPVIHRAAGPLRDDPCRRASPRHQCEWPDPLGIIAADDRFGRKVIRTQTERPDNIAVTAYLDDPIIKLIGNQDIAVFVEFPV